MIGCRSKNALLYEANAAWNDWSSLECQDYRKVGEFAHRICHEGLEKLLPGDKGGYPYYFGLGRSRMKESCVEKLRRMMAIILSEETEKFLKVFFEKEWVREENCGSDGDNEEI